MTTSTTVLLHGEHRIELPGDMTVIHEGWKSSNDHLVYRGVNIFTYADDEPPAGGALYIGPFSVALDDGDGIKVSDLDTARQLIDTRLLHDCRIIEEIWREVFGKTETTQLVGSHNDWTFWRRLLNTRRK